MKKKLLYVRYSQMRLSSKFFKYLTSNKYLEHDLNYFRNNYSVLIISATL